MVPSYFSSWGGVPEGDESGMEGVFLVGIYVFV